MSLRPRILASLLACASFATGCKKEEAAAPPPPPPAAPIEVTVLVTSDENGYLLPQTIEGRRTGGAAELLGQWIAKEGHCVVGGANCAPERTIALSTGDHWGGPALSSRFLGAPVAEAMGRMNYAATGLGNHDLDFGREQFTKNMNMAGVPVVAANLKTEGPAAEGLRFPGHMVLERDGARIGVIGLTFIHGPKRSMSGRYDGARVVDYATALSETVPKAWAQGADALVVLVDDCPRELEPMIQSHPEWKISLVAGGHCDAPYEAKVGDTTLLSPGQRFERYARAVAKVDPSKPEGQRLVGFEASVVPVDDAAKPEPKLAEMLAVWKSKTDQELEQQIGYSKSGFALGSPELARWVTTALREATQADAAIINKGGLRAGVPAGKVTVGNVYSALPFENSVMIIQLTGEQLAQALQNPQAVSDLTLKGGKVMSASGKALDPATRYKVATIEFLYFGGDGFTFEVADLEPTPTGMLWQAPVLDWTRAKNSSEREPLEAAIR